MIEELVARVFDSRNAAHILHWKTHSYAQHVALGDFYDGAIEHIDGIVEAFQGAFDLIKMQSLPKGAIVGDDLVPQLEEDLMFIHTNRGAITNGLPGIDNLLQGLEGLYMSTIYKLKNLK